MKYQLLPDNSIQVEQQSNNQCAAKLQQQHAEIVTKMIEDGIVEVIKPDGHVPICQLE